MDVVFTTGQYTQVSMILNTFGVQLDAGQTLDPELKGVLSMAVPAVRRCGCARTTARARMRRRPGSPIPHQARLRAAVPREAFSPPGPWEGLSALRDAALLRLRTDRDGEARELYRDVLDRA